MLVMYVTVIVIYNKFRLYISLYTENTGGTDFPGDSRKVVPPCILQSDDFVKFGFHYS